MKSKSLLRIFSILAFTAFAAIVSGKTHPMTLRSNVEIPDGENLHYTIYIGREKYGEFNMITRFVTKNKVKAYLNRYIFTSKEKRPSNYTNYTWYAIVDLNTASMTKYHLDDTDEFVNKNDNKGLYFYDMTFGSNYTTVARFWDGYESREQRFTTKNIDTSYPLWYYDAFVFWGGRLLNWDGGGAFNLFNPATKEPVIGTLTKIGEEKIETPLGVFNTDKVVMVCADPFLAALLKQFTESMIFYIEKSPKRRLIKLESQANDQIWILDGETIEKGLILEPKTRN